MCRVKLHIACGQISKRRENRQKCMRTEMTVIHSVDHSLAFLSASHSSRFRERSYEWCTAFAGLAMPDAK